MRNKNFINDLFQNNKFTLVFSFVAAIVVWLVVVVTVSPQTTRVIKNVKVTIDETVPSQFGLSVFGEKEFTVDVTVKGKKYQISNAALSADDISVVAVTKDVENAGYYTLQLKAEPGEENASYSISSLSMKTIRVYFDTETTRSFVVEPKVITGDFEIVADGFSCGDINIAEPMVTLTGPSAQIDKVDKVVAKVELFEPLTMNKSTETPITILDSNGNDSFEHITLSKESVVVIIPVLRVKSVNTAVTFKNAPELYDTNPLKYSVTPDKAEFELLVSEYDNYTEEVVGSINFNELSVINNIFIFEKTIAGKTETFKVTVDMDEYDQEYIKIADNKIAEKISGDTSLYKFSGLNRSVVLVGKPEDLADITEDMISIEVDLSSVSLDKGETTTIPAVVTVESDTCWVYGSYTLKISK